MESVQQKSRDLEQAKTVAESLAMKRETELMAGRRRWEEEGREKEERVWELTRELQSMEESRAQAQAKVDLL